MSVRHLLLRCPGAPGRLHGNDRSRTHSNNGDATVLTFGIYLGFLAVLLIAAIVRPPVGFAAVVCMYGLEQWAQARSGFFEAHQTLTNYLCGALVLAAVTLKALRSEGRWLPFKDYPTVGWLAIALVLWALVTAAWSIQPQLTLEPWTKGMPAYLAVTLLLAPLLVSDLWDLRTALHATFWAGAFILVLLAVTEFSTEGRGGVQLVSGVAGNPLAVASLAGHVFIIGLLSNFAAPGGRVWLWRAARWAVLLLALYVAVRSDSRGQVIAMLAVGVVFLPISRGVRSIGGVASTALGLVVVTAGTLVVFDALAVSPQRWSVDTILRALGHRLQWAMSLLDYWADSGFVHILLGLGNSASIHVLGFYPHFVPAEVLAEEGLVGLGIYAAILVLCARAIVRLTRWLAPYPEARGLGACIGALFCFEMALTLKQGTLLGDQYWFTFAIVLAAVESATGRLVQHAQAPWLAYPPASAPMLTGSATMR